VLQSGPDHGTLQLNSNGSFTYTPEANFAGEDSFTYRVSDGSLSSAAATVTLTVSAVNDAPQASADAYVVNGGFLEVNAPGVLENDGDLEGPLSAELVQGPGSALLFSLNPDGSFSYTAGLGFTGTDSFTYRASDGSLQSLPVTVTITVQ
jgi:VCBS repeat-containing protein